MYALFVNGVISKYPYSITQLKKDNPQISFPENMTHDVLVAYGVYFVAPTEQPQIDLATQKMEEGTPALVAGEWTQVWNIVELTAQEQQQYLQDLHNTIASQTQQRLDDFARTRNYDGILSACTYATSAVPKFAAEGQYAVQARDATWAALYQFMADVQAGTQPVPTGFEDVEPLLPPLAWPI